MLDYYLQRQKEIFEELILNSQLEHVEEINIKTNLEKFNGKQEIKDDENNNKTDSEVNRQNYNNKLKIVEGKSSELKRYFEEIEEQKTITIQNSKETNVGKYFENVVRKSLLDKLLENGIKREIEKNSREKIYWSITELNECLLKTLYRHISNNETRDRLLKKSYNPLLSLYGVSGDSIHKLIQEYLSQEFGEKLIYEYTIINEEYKIKGRLDILIRSDVDVIIELKTTGNKNLSSPYLSHYNQCQIQMFCMKEVEKSSVDSAILWYLPVDKYFIIEYDFAYINDLKSKVLKLTEMYERFKVWKENHSKEEKKTVIVNSKRNFDEDFVLYNSKELKVLKDERFCKFCEFKEWCYKFNIIKDKS